MKKIAWRFVCSTFFGGVFIYKNMGSDSLHIYYIVSSWDYPETRCSKFHAAPGDTLQLKVSFRSDSVGVFVREFHIYGNFFLFATWSDGGGRDCI